MYTKNLIYYFMAIVIFIVFKFWFRNADNNDLIFILKPTNKLVELFTSSPSSFVENIGYFHPKHNINIEKSCSGFNFWMLSFIMFIFLALKFLNKTFQKIWLFPIALFVAYLLTIFANTSRIILSILGQNIGDQFLPKRPHMILHDLIGAFVYLFFLILSYLILDKYLTKKFLKNEKFT